jgi:hypothetical protein
MTLAKKGNNVNMRLRMVTLLAGTVLLCASTGFAQQPSVPAVHQNDYVISRESSLQGKVVEYTATSHVAPVGAHVTVQTSSGIVDVHLGNVRLINANHLTLEAGDSVTITGENVPFGSGTVFAARIIQKGSVSVTLRSKNGMPLLVTPRTTNSQQVSAGAR